MTGLPLCFGRLIALGCFLYGLRGLLVVGLHRLLIGVLFGFLLIVVLIQSSFWGKFRHCL